MKNILLLVFLISGFFIISAKGQEDDATSGDAFSGYLNWSKVNQVTITGDDTGVLGAAHERAKGFREIYVNDIGKSTAYRESDYPYPVGSVIIKESYSADDGAKGILKSITIMVKREAGYDPDNGDWEYAMTDENLKVSRQGKINMCISCHSVMSDKDFTFWDNTF